MSSLYTLVCKIIGEFVGEMLPGSPIFRSFHLDFQLEKRGWNTIGRRNPNLAKIVNERLLLPI